MAANATNKSKKAGRPPGSTRRKAAKKLTEWDKQAAKVKRLTLALKRAQDKLKEATDTLRDMPQGK